MPEDDFGYYDDVDLDVIRAELEHDALLNTVLERADYIDYKSVDLDKQRISLYAALKEFAYNEWATADMIALSADIGDGNMETLLEGLFYLRELEMDLNSEGDVVYRLTDFGKSWIRLFIFE